VELCWCCVATPHCMRLEIYPISLCRSHHTLNSIRLSTVSQSQLGSGVPQHNSQHITFSMDAHLAIVFAFPFDTQQRCYFLLAGECKEYFTAGWLTMTASGLVVRVPGYRSRSPKFDSRRYQIFWEVVGLERGPLSLMRIIEEVLEWKSSGSGLENQD
jgi:hypothetical protein